MTEPLQFEGYSIPQTLHGILASNLSTATEEIDEEQDEETYVDLYE